MRDERGYEHTSLLHTVRRHGRTDTCLLYWFRTPPYIKVGRAALDDDVQRRLEAQYPDIEFDWNRILREPPQALPEREAARRKEQRDSRDARRKRKRPPPDSEPGSVVEAAVPKAEPSPWKPNAEARQSELTDLEDEDSPEDSSEDLDVQTDEPESGVQGEKADGPDTPAGPARPRRRRRRRRGKPPGGSPGGAPGGDPPPNSSV